MRANQLRLWFAAFAYVLICALRRIGLAGTEMAAATCGTIRLKLLKIGALVTISVRRIKIAMASACPFQTCSPPPAPGSDAPRPETARSARPQTGQQSAEPAQPAIAADSPRAWQRCSSAVSLPEARSPPHAVRKPG